MILNTQDLKNISTKILSAVDSSEISTITETIELKVQNQALVICVTNREYVAEVKLFLGYNEEFHASVNASLFLNLISQITTEDIELSCKDNYLLIRGNGSYKLPLIFDGDHLLTLPRIDILNVVCEMNIDTSILQSILKYNSKELTKGYISRPVQKMYYMDERGCLTFTTGACVNNFSLERPIRVLLNNKIVKLFKLFTEDSVRLTLGYDSLSNDMIQEKIRFEDENMSLTAILGCDNSLINTVPVVNIRSRAEAVYPYSIIISKEALVQAVNRLLLFSKSAKSVNQTAEFTFSKDSVIIKEPVGDNSETISYLNSCSSLDSESPFAAVLDLNDLKATLNICDEAHLTINFGTGGAFVIARANILNVIPQCA